MSFNVWLEIRDNFPFPAEDPADDTELQAKNRLNMGAAPDQVVVTSLFKNRQQGPRFYYLYSLYYYTETQAEMELSVQNLQFDNPGHVVILAGWNVEDGSQIGTTLTYDGDGNVTGYTGTPVYLQAANLFQFMPDVGDPPVADPTLRDVNLGLGHPPRYFV